MASLIGVAVLAGIATVVLVAYRVPAAWSPLIAIARGAVQLAAISVILTEVIDSPALIAVALIVMFSVAVTVATRRIGWTWRAVMVFAASIGAGASVALVVVFATGALELSSRYLLAIGAIVIGGAMSVSVLAARSLTRSVRDQWDTVEGWLALGAGPRRATIDLARLAVRDALIPATDQTKTTGLVVLPGAFVGAIFGGLPPLEAGRFQVVVLAAIMAAGAVTAVLVATWLAPVRQKPDGLP